jgi:hypothetical protein
VAPSASRPSESQAYFRYRLLLAASRVFVEGNSNANVDADADADADADGSLRSWNSLQYSRPGVMKWLTGLLHGKNHGADHSVVDRNEFELGKAAILQESRRRNGTESGEQRKLPENAKRSAGVIQDRAPLSRGGTALLGVC